MSWCLKSFLIFSTLVELEGTCSISRVKESSSLSCKLSFFLETGLKFL